MEATAAGNPRRVRPYNLCAFVWLLMWLSEWALEVVVNASACFLLPNPCELLDGSQAIASINS